MGSFKFGVGSLVVKVGHNSVFLAEEVIAALTASDEVDLLVLVGIFFAPVFHEFNEVVIKTCTRPLSDVKVIRRTF